MLFNSVAVQPILRYCTKKYWRGICPPSSLVNPHDTHKCTWKILPLFYLQLVFTNQSSAENHYDFHDISWNKHIKISKCSDKHQTSLEIQQKFFTFYLTLSWVTCIEALLQANFLNKNLTVNELRGPLSTSSGPSTSSQEGVHWYMQHYFRRFSLEGSLKNFVTNYRNVKQQLLKATSLHRKTEWRNIWSLSD
jgi:hypothetical protein